MKNGALLYGLLCAVCCIAVAALYRVPAEAVFYAVLLCLALGAAFWTARYFDRKRRLEQLRAALKHPAGLDTPLPAPRSDEEAAYQELIRALRLTLAREQDEHQNTLRDLRDDYTLWAHQIKTPIAALKLLLTEEDQEQAIELQRIEDYVEMALTVQRLTGGGELVPRACDLDGIIRKALRKHSRLFVRKRLSLRYEPISRAVITDEKWLGFLLEQILLNALKYTDQGGITLSLRGDVLLISDTGIGIAPEELPRVFERGYTGYNGRLEGRATGMGLYLCKRIADLLGHSIQITSQPGRGTCVAIGFSRENLAID